MRFAIIDVDQASLPGKPKNVVGLVFREQEVGYLAGYLAARVDAASPGPHAIGSVGGMKEPPVDRYIAGYQAGARRAAPGIKLLNGYSQDWDDEAKCKEAALDQIARGAGVVFQVAGGCGLGALDAAKEKHVWGVGVDADQSFLGPAHPDERAEEGRPGGLRDDQVRGRRTWRGGRNLVFGLRQDGVGLGKISPRATKADLAAVRKVSKQISAGADQDPDEGELGRARGKLERRETMFPPTEPPSLPLRTIQAVVEPPAGRASAPAATVGRRRCFPPRSPFFAAVSIQAAAALRRAARLRRRSAGLH